MNYAEMKRLSQQHARHPQPGDFWHDFYTPMYLVIEVQDNRVLFLRRIKTISTGTGTWTWDYTHVDILSIDAFHEMLMYNNRELGPMYDVIPDWKHWREFATEAIMHRLNNGVT